MQTTKLPTDYQSYIHLSRYARWDNDKQRRETWEETVDRYVSFFQTRNAQNAAMQSFKWEEIRTAILTLQVMPSMRCLMTAGLALSLDNVAGFNCSYVAIDDPIAFDEILYVLMCGTGVGFSVERQFVNKLPPLPDSIKPSSRVIFVDDSKIGWATAYRELLTCLWQGAAPQWDVSEVRPAGAPLKIFGGRASGPAPLVDLFRFTTHLFTNAVGRKLTSLECHDLVCKIADIVVVGGVRRSALISLSNLSDDRMRHAKSGAWWETTGHRALANNSVAYTERPEMGAFMREWLSLYDSRSGERGIFNRVAAQKQAASNGRRNAEYDFGVNPCCVTGDTLVLTNEGHRPIVDLIGHSVKVWNGSQWSSVVPFETGKHEIFRVMLSDGAYLDCTANHKFAIDFGDGCYEMIMASRLAIGHKLAKFDIPNEALVVSGVDAAKRRLVNLGLRPARLKGREQWIQPGKAQSVHILYVESLNVEAETYCFDEPIAHLGTFNGIVTGQSEIILRSRQFCNLSEVVIRANDTEDTLHYKAEIAAQLGTLQATLTDFRYLSPEWKKNTEDEALLGVSMTGIMDHPLLSNYADKRMPAMLERLRETVVATNRTLAKRLGIKVAAASTCVKPSGTVSQLVHSGSGMHARYSEYYFRTVRADKKDPMSMLMRDAGVYVEDDVTKPDATDVFYFPMQSPANAITRNDRTALEQLELWKLYQLHWCEHKPSITVYVRENEWLEVGAWVWKNFDIVSGVSFLPHNNSDTVYKQAPYQEIDAKTYAEWLAKMPAEIDWSRISVYEGTEDKTTNTRDLACAAGVCEL